MYLHRDFEKLSTISNIYYHMGGVGFRMAGWRDETFEIVESFPKFRCKYIGNFWKSKFQMFHPICKNATDQINYRSNYKRFQIARFRCKM